MDTYMAFGNDYEAAPPSRVLSIVARSEIYLRCSQLGHAQELRQVIKRLMDNIPIIQLHRTAAVTVDSQMFAEGAARGLAAISALDNAIIFHLCPLYPPSPKYFYLTASSVQLDWKKRFKLRFTKRSLLPG